jgi:hypothetical protein
MVSEGAHDDTIRFPWSVKDTPFCGRARLQKCFMWPNGSILGAPTH